MNDNHTPEPWTHHRAPMVSLSYKGSTMRGCVYASIPHLGGSWHVTGVDPDTGDRWNLQGYGNMPESIACKLPVIRFDRASGEAVANHMSGPVSHPFHVINRARHCGIPVVPPSK